MRQFSIRTALVVIVILALALALVAQRRRAVIVERLSALQAEAVARQQVEQMRAGAKRPQSAAARPESRVEGDR